MKKIHFKKPRINLIISKKHLIIVGMTLVLGIAIYANYVIGANNLVATPKIDVATGETQENYGDVQFVSKQSQEKDISITDGTDGDSYFAEARLDRQESRDQAKEFLVAMYNGGDGTVEELQVMAQDASKLSNYIESESTVENLLKAQGFEDVLCYFSDTTANVIVKTSGLEAADAAKIKNAILSEIAVPAQNITIVEIN